VEEEEDEGVVVGIPRSLHHKFKFRSALLTSRYLSLSSNLHMPYHHPSNHPTSFPQTPPNSIMEPTEPPTKLDPPEGCKPIFIQVRRILRQPYAYQKG